MNPEVQSEIEKRVLAMSNAEREAFSAHILTLAKAFRNELRCAMVVNHPDGRLDIHPVAASQAEAMNLLVSTHQFFMIYDTFAGEARH
jgi:hypothetical protein